MSGIVAVLVGGIVFVGVDGQMSPTREKNRYSGESPSQTYGSLSRRLEDEWRAAIAAPDQRNRATLLSLLVRRTPVSNWPTLLDLIARLQPAQLRFALQRELLVRWAKVDGTTAIAQAQALTTATEPEFELITSVLAAWTIREPKAAITWVAQSSPGDPAPSWIGALASALKNYTPEQVLEFTAQALDGRAIHDVLMTALIEYWKDESPGAAAHLAAIAATGERQADLLGRIVPQWSRSDLRGALDWVRQLPHGQAQTAALVHLSYAWVDSDIAGAAEFARQSFAENAPFLINLVSQWAQKDPLAAATWTQQLPEGPSKDRALSTLVSTWAKEDPRSAAAFVYDLPAGAGRHDALASVVSAWASREPALAAQWAESFPSGRPREYGLEIVFYTWAQTDPIAAMTWLQRMPTGIERDTAIHASAGRIVATFPDLALQLAIAIGNEALRDQQVERAARAWLAIEAEAAWAWIDRSSLPLRLKQRLAATSPRR